MVIGLVLAVGSGGTLLVIEITMSKLNGAIAQSDLGIGGDSQARRQVTGPLNILLAGLDYRKDDPASQEASRADSVMWVYIPREHDRAYILSLPRDLQVEIPQSKEANFQGAVDGRLNASFAYGMANDQGRQGGMKLLLKTVEHLTGVTFDMAAIIDWYGFTGITGQLGGVEMCLDKGFTSSQPGFAGYQFPAGCNHYDEHNALALVRQRYDVPGGDYGRQQLQQQFVKQILKQATQANVISNPTKLNGIIKAVGESFLIDRGGYEFTDLIWSLKGITADDMVSIQVPHASIGTPSDYGGEQLIEPVGRDLFKALVDDKIDTFLSQHPELAPRLPV